MKNQQIGERNARYIPGGYSSQARRLKDPIAFVSAKGSRVTDAEGRTFTDHNSAFGAIILGHCHDEHMRRVAELSRGIDQIGLGMTTLEGDLAELVCTHVPSAERVNFCCSGTEATFHAIRLARAATGRRYIVKFQGAYHGWHDYVAVNFVTPRADLGKITPFSAGTLDLATEATLVLTFNDVAGFKALMRERGHEIAAVIIEPVMHNVGGFAANDAFLKTLREESSRSGTVLIFDEIITGFRHALGGYQSLCGITPDLTTFGKAIANGYPLAGVCGREDIMRRLGPMPTGEGVFFGGTYNAFPPSVAAGIATISLLKELDGYTRLFALGDRMRHGLAGAIERTGIQARVAGFGSIWMLHFIERDPHSYEELVIQDADLDMRFRAMMLDRGHLLAPQALRRMTLNLAHTEADIDATVAAAEEVLSELVRMQLLESA